MQARYARRREASPQAKSSEEPANMQTSLDLLAALRQPTLFKPQELATHFRAYALACPAKDVFESEAHLEQTVLHDPKALEVFSQLLGIGIAGIARQVRTGRMLAQRADLVAVGEAPKMPLIVIELMCRPLDGEHITRSVGYAAALKATDIILVATEAPDPARQLIAALRDATDRLGITVHLVRLETLVLDGEPAYHLRPLTPPRAPRPRQSFLEALAIRTAELGDDSLINNTVFEGKRIESYQGLADTARIRIYGGHGNARISILTGNRRTYRKLLRKHLAEKVLAHLEPYRPATFAKHGKSTVAAYGFRIDTSDPRATSLSLTRIAMAYIEVRKHLLAAVGDFARAPASRATPVKYWTNASDLGALPVALRPPPRYSVQ
jgi:hypothetical protein